MRTRKFAFEINWPLQETPQCVVLNLVPQFLGENDVSSILNSFKSMSDTNQKEYLKLHNRFAIFNDLNQEDKKTTVEWGCVALPSTNRVIFRLLNMPLYGYSWKLEHVNFIKSYNLMMTSICWEQHFWTPWRQPVGTLWPNTCFPFCFGGLSYPLV